jgi:hypothetical protein
MGRGAVYTNVRKKPTALVWVIGVIVVLVALRFGLPAIHHPDDRTLIHQALADSIQASKEGRPGGVLDKLSDKFKINDMEPGTRHQIADFIRNSRPDVVIKNDTVQFVGDEARMVTPVEIQANVLGQNMSRTLNPVTLVFRKEDATEYLIIPTRAWKLAEVQVHEQAVTEFLQ